MKGVCFFLIVILVFLFSGCSNIPREVLIDSFEGFLDKETVDFGSSDNSSIKVAADKKHKACGEQSIKMEYDLKPSGYMWMARGFNLDVKGANAWEIKPEDIFWSRYNAISISMYGANTGGVIAFDIKDAQGELWRFLLEDDFDGWREVICPFKHFFDRQDWQPDDAEVNGVLDFPIVSFQFEPRLPGEGVYYFDCVKVIKTK